MDTTLSWHEHVNNTVNKVQSKINAIRMIQRNFMSDKLLQLLKTYSYPSRYYALGVWLNPSLNTKLKSRLFSASGRILSVIKIGSYQSLHKQLTRATPEMWQNYELAISLFDLNHTRLPCSDWLTLQRNILQNRRSTKLHFTSTNRLCCVLNILPNRLKLISNKIDTTWLTLTSI
jgi:hypothetical protein